MISLSNTNRLWVHDLLQDMAEDIICDGKDEKPWKRLMLWDFEDINHVFSSNVVSRESLLSSLLCLILASRHLNV